MDSNSVDQDHQPLLQVGRPGEVPEVSSEQLIDGALEMVFLLVGGITLLVVVIQGMRYALSMGDPKKTESARNGIIYAGVGSTIAFTAWSLVHFMLNRVLRSSTVDTDNADMSAVTILLVDIAGLLVFIGAIIAIIVVLVGVMKLVTSDGDSKKAVSARSTIIYAIVGLVVCIAAGPLIYFFLERIGGG